MPPDYNRQNLQGRSFKGQDLTGANFSQADIRGANFTNADLTGAKFNEAIAGTQKLFITFLVIFLFFLSGISGLSSGASGYMAAQFFNNLAIDNQFNSSIAFFVLLSLLLIIINQGIIGLVVGLIITAILVGIFTILGYNNYTASFSVSGAFAGTLATSIAFVTAYYIAGMFGGILIAIFSIIGACIGSFYISAFTKYRILNNTLLVTSVSGNLIGIFAVSCATLFSVYVAWQTIKRNNKYSILHNIALLFITFNGTSFHGADLTDADFTGATLKNTDFRAANLTRTRFYEAKKLDFARPDNTILSNPDILNLLITLNGRNKSYIGANLRGANLIGADLKEANFKNADIIEATFQGANLEGANLTLTQAVGTNFTKAHITGACVEAWNIESTTKLDNVDCRFVYLLEYPKPRTDDRERRPSSGEFQPGEFTKLFEEVLNTVDLIFRNGIDWKAFITAFKKVQVENQDTELVIQSIENKGDGVVVVKVAVPENANKEKIHSDFTENYQLALAAVEEKYKAVLQAKDEEINFHRQQSGKIPEMILSLANKPINVQIDNKVENKNMTNSNDSSRKVEIGSIGRDFNASGQALNLGEISGTVTNTINELATAPEPDKPGITELLTQLKTAIETDTDLTAKDKE
ncbi:pentapeptide repeat-containing protein, partial [Dolichospermum circinale CS-545/17]|nr:pentapeptide repeat-containing protein [Dolichospermum circinale CS-545/17]